MSGVDKAHIAGAGFDVYAVRDEMTRTAKELIG
jgi:hypothetical protein